MVRKADGFALIDVIFVCGLIGVLSSIALPRVLLAKQVAGAAAAVGSMRAINSAELTYALTCGSGFYAPSLRVLGTAPPGSIEPFISGGLGQANIYERAGYIIQLSATPYTLAPAGCNGLGPGEAGQGFKSTADPVETGNTRFFSTNSYLQIFESSSSLWATMPETGEPLDGVPLR